MVAVKTLLAICFLFLQSGVTALRVHQSTPSPAPSTTTEAEDMYKVSYEDYWETWEQFKLEYKRDYESASEEIRRFVIFFKNVRKIESHNWQFQNGLTTYWMDINQFTDWTDEEFQSILSPIMANVTVETELTHTIVDVKVRDEVDWRNYGYVTAVKNQLQCGSSWAFSATGSLEGQWFARNGSLISLSEQQLLDCSRRFGNLGCNGGWMKSAFRYVIANGMAGENDYPYVARERLCRYQRNATKAFMTNYQDVHRNEHALRRAVARVGPVSVAVAVSDNFRNYGGGLFIDDNCTVINHGMLVVGYGRWPAGGDHWTVKNSWGTSWGQSGYIYIARNSGNMCQIASMASYPIV